MFALFTVLFIGLYWCLFKAIRIAFNTVIWAFYFLGKGIAWAYKTIRRALKKHRLQREVDAIQQELGLE
ncbi:hypothetical protein KPC83_05365 [Collinsella sp. zg1085]|uniref:hypothetical protein n=1 Tax=Collinsella sp. zg1085 TaxID=2844380 RepID=UPI001C0AE2A4|nr:hypothetical protein [Collinsella sp. zg1085]QWT17270.1 hypothetical protein KPC83_05365 [Collinsella sp. zg1085]